jgi:CheY-like chemotaxis protein
LELPAPTWKHKEKQSPESGGSHSVPDWDGRHLQVLVAEDNDLNILYLKALLQKWDVRFDIVRDGLQALEALTVATYDVLLLDVQMPEMDGISTLIELRKRDIKGRSELALPVFMVTAFADDETRKMAMRHGANGFLAKPYSPEAMLDALKIAEY